MDKAFFTQFQVNGQALPEEVVGAILAQAEAETAALQADYEAKAAKLAFQGRVKEAITQARGRNGKAIAALLDLEALEKAPPEALTQALDQVRQAEPYLFDQEAAPPPYAPGPGAYAPPRRRTMEELEKLPMEEYRAYRLGEL